MTKKELLKLLKPAIEIVNAEMNLIIYKGIHKGVLPPNYKRKSIINS